MVVYVEPDEHGAGTEVRLTEAEAVERQREHGRSRGVDYATDEEALDDFMVLHWAWVEE